MLFLKLFSLVFVILSHLDQIFTILIAVMLSRIHQIDPHKQLMCLKNEKRVEILQDTVNTMRHSFNRLYDIFLTFR